MLTKFILLFSLFASSSCAGRTQLQYNYFTGKYEYAPAGSELRYNSFERRWEYAPRDAVLKYNYMERVWEFSE